MEDLIPTKFQLSQNYPDPFKERTTIKYCIPKKMNITLEVFDSKGYKVKTLVDEIKDAGTYKIVFSTRGGSASGGNALSLPSGVYFYQLRAVDPRSSSGQVFIETKKMMLLN